MKKTLIKQLENTIEHAEIEQVYMKDKGLGTIIARYKEALEIVVHKPKKMFIKEDFNLWGSVGIYLSSLQDFTNPLVPELALSEKMLATFIDNQVSEE